MKHKILNIGIIGVGLIGGSIALGLKHSLGKKVCITGRCKSFLRTNRAIKMGIIDEELIFSKEFLENIDYLICATPVLTTIEVIKKIHESIASHTIVLDVGSTKEFLCKTIQKNFADISFIGTHPMAGSEQQGFEYSAKFLFKDKPWIITPDQSVNINRINKVKKLILSLGAKPKILSPHQHDEIVAFISHLPMVVSSILMSTIAKNSHWNSLSGLASTGFKDTTRLASSPVDLKTQMLMTNREQIISALNEFLIRMNKFIRFIKNDNNKALKSFYQRTKSARDNWLQTNSQEYAY